VRTAEQLQQRLGVPVEIENDVNLGALAEVTVDTAKGARDAIYVNVGSGVEAALILDGRLHHGTRGFAGELDHVIVHPVGALCRCGNRGCLETRAGASALLERLRPRYGADITLDGVLLLARNGDVGCRRVLTDAGRTIGGVLANVCNVLNPEVIVVGGELGLGCGPLLNGVREAIHRYALSTVAESVGVRGSCSARAPRCLALWR
jgi:predicted NBD/HSP70 family sugar kinase